LTRPLTIFSRPPVKPSDRVKLNPGIVVTNLGSEGFAVYVPPQPTPHRFSQSSWNSITALDSDSIYFVDLPPRLAPAVPARFETVSQYCDYLIESRILLLTTDITQEYQTTPDIAGFYVSPASASSPEYDESSGYLLFTSNPSWPSAFRIPAARLLIFQINLAMPMLLVILAYLVFSLFSSSPSPLRLLDIPSSSSQPLGIIQQFLIALFTVNLISTASSWFAQSITGLGDGKVLLRWLFGFIPRLGVNSALQTNPLDSVDTADNGSAVVCAAQPLLTRLWISSALILLLASGRFPTGFGVLEWRAIAYGVLQISLITFVILLLPFRASPGYRLLVLLTDLPANTLGYSYKRLFLILSSLLSLFTDRDASSLSRLQSVLSTRRDWFLFLFAICSASLIVAQLVFVILYIIPKFASGIPSLFGPATETIVFLVLIFLLFRFVSTTILPKLSRLSSTNTISSSRALLPLHLVMRPKPFFIMIIISCFLFFPINRTVSGSVVVSPTRDLTVRAPADVRIIAIDQHGPSSTLIPQGSLLLRLQSQQLTQDLYQTNADLGRLQNDLLTLQQKLLADRLLVRESLAALKLSQQSNAVINSQLRTLEKLSLEGAYSHKLVQDTLLKSYEIQSEERSKLQRLFDIQQQIAQTQVTISSTKEALLQSQQWKQSLQSEERQLTVKMPFDGIITTSTSGLLGSFVSKGEPLLELKQGSLRLVDVLIPDHDRSLVKPGQSAHVRLYAEQSDTLKALVQSIRPTGELVDNQAYFQATLRLDRSLNPQLLQSSGAARINTGTTNLFSLALNSIGRFVLVDFWSWTP